MLRMIIGPNRSGTTALLRCFENNPSVDAVLYQPIKASLRLHGVSDLSFIDKYGANNKGAIYVAKDTIGQGLATSNINESTYKCYRTIDDFITARHLFLFRNPIQTFLSDHIQFGIESSQFILAYRTAHEQAMLAIKTSKLSTCLTLEHLLSAPESVLRRICKKWDIEFSSKMIKWDAPPFKKTIICEHEKTRLNSTLRAAKQNISQDCLSNLAVNSYTPPSGLEKDIEHISHELTVLYETIKSESEGFFLKNEQC